MKIVNITKKTCVSAHISYRCCANIPRYYKPMYDDYEKIGNGFYRVKGYKD